MLEIWVRRGRCPSQKSMRAAARMTAVAAVCDCRAVTDSALTETPLQHTWPLCAGLGFVRRSQARRYSG